MRKTDLNILLTRPIDKSQSLARELEPLAQHIEIQPLFSYQHHADCAALTAAITQRPQHIIFVSEAAAKFALQTCAPDIWPNNSLYYAVGPATAKALAPITSNLYTGQTFDSEGLLALPSLQRVNDQNILIIRGNGGREHLAQTLRQRQANVAYNEVYQRQWLSLDAVQLIEKWRKLKINCMVVTSEALLDKAVALFANTDTLFKQEICWVVASERIAEKAKKYQLSRVVNAGGASNRLIVQAIAAM
ncbi:uroporphyrinogen-III synthase [Thalassotalea litorea]|uniref:uroporphyrinogen-III synthase n=1 Tax=Thalassotalea litorea TaxID=2020715 RepID=UPI003735B79F